MKDKMKNRKHKREWRKSRPFVWPKFSKN